MIVVCLIGSSVKVVTALPQIERLNPGTRFLRQIYKTVMSSIIGVRQLPDTRLK
jgi:hypothetical protein